MMLIVINASSVICAGVMLVTAFSLYRLARSSGVLMLLIACLYLTVVRLLVAGAETFDTGAWVLDYRSHLIAPFWPLMAAGFLLLLRSMRKLIPAHREER